MFFLLCFFFLANFLLGDIFMKKQTNTCYKNILAGQTKTQPADPAELAGA